VQNSQTVADKCQGTDPEIKRECGYFGDSESGNVNFGSHLIVLIPVPKEVLGNHQITARYGFSVQGFYEAFMVGLEGGAFQQFFRPECCGKYVGRVRRAQKLLQPHFLAIITLRKRPLAQPAPSGGEWLKDCVFALLPQD